VGHGKGEFNALTGLAFDRDITLHDIEITAREVKPSPTPLGTGVRLFQLLRWVEDFSLIFGGKAFPVSATVNSTLSCSG
jgi:hypothetical protein